MTTPTHDPLVNFDDGWRLVGKKTKTQIVRQFQHVVTKANAYNALMADEEAANPIGGDDRLNKNPVTNYEVRYFQDFVHDLGLIEIKSKGSFYSWNNKGHGIDRIATRIDRVLVNEAWILAYGQTEAIYLTPSLSAHCPVMIEFVNDVAGKVLKKLKYVKTGLKSLNTHHFSKNQETTGIEKVKYWMDTYESILKQKSRVDWIKLGDSNTHYFFYIVKQRQNRNRIDSIYTANDVLLKDPDLVQAEIISFYQNLLGSAASTLPVVGVAVVRAGKQLSSNDIDNLFAPISHDEIDQPLSNIRDDKAPDFFETGVLEKSWSCTTLTLVSKIGKGCGSVVNNDQAGFIPGKHIGDNILLATELIKGYAHKFFTPRCMLKIDLRKAYDYVECSFLKTMLYDQWYPSALFQPKKGLKQGNPMSPFLFALCMEIDLGFVKILFEAFQKFFVASGLSANFDKSDAYFKGILDNERCELQQVLGMANGTLPFRYLGVPLSSKKLTKCIPLIERVTSIIDTWDAKHLPYAGRLQLSYGGWNLISLEDWNKAAVTKVLWDLANKSDNLWILASRDIMNDIGGWDNVTVNGKMQIKKLYIIIKL
ncbi:uncharacterized protein LOC110732005 [Chenopodium quinoa]|uniref:uncharacterized protein LOC110732005 n=1 Tax=Chenopodium quinoa TaxID=63459 RepID=UPI000B77BFF2|nr:uncharacterized protein LOC110732005 [Chenopodium quinoa]